MILGDSPVERAVAWLISILADGSPFERSDIVARFGPHFLAAVPAEQIESVLRSAATQEAGAHIESVSFRSPTEAVVVLAAEGHRTGLWAVVEEEEPHRFLGAQIRPLSGSESGWAEIADDVRAHDWCETDLEPSFAERIIAMRDESAIPGLAAAIIRRGRVVHRQGLGVSSLAAPQPITMNSVFRAGSVTKVVTALALLRLGVEGRLSLDDPVAQHLRTFPLVPFETSDPPVTIRHVLTHTSGLPRHQDELDTESTMAETFAGGLSAVAHPGTEHVYSNVGFGMLGQLIADVTGRSYAEHVRETLFEPLGMATAVIAPRGVGGPVVGYDDVGGLGPVEENWVVDEGAGALCASADDLVRLAIAVCARDSRIASSSSIEDALTSQEPHIPVAGPSQGLAFVVYEAEGHRIAWHNGGLDGWRSAWYLAPDDGSAVVLLANRFSAPLDPLARTLMSTLLEG